MDNSLYLSKLIGGTGDLGNGFSSINLPQKIIGEGVSGNKWINIEVAQNTIEVGDPLTNFENNVQMKKCKHPCKMNKSMQNIFQRKTIQNTRKIHSNKKSYHSCLYLYMYIFNI